MLIHDSALAQPELSNNTTFCINTCAQAIHLTRKTFFDFSEKKSSELKNGTVMSQASLSTGSRSHLLPAKAAPSSGQKSGTIIRTKKWHHHPDKKVAPSSGQKSGTINRIKKWHRHPDKKVAPSSGQKNGTVIPAKAGTSVRLP